MANYLKLEFPSLPENVALARACVGAFASQLDGTLEEIEEIRLVVSEAVSNCVVHAYPPTGDHRIEVRSSITEEGWLEISVEDWGVGIEDLEAVMQTSYSSRPDHMGLGFTFMQTFMSNVEVRSTPGQGTRVTMLRRFAPEPTQH